MIKGGIQQEDITVIKIYVLNTTPPGDIQKILLDLKGETDSSTVIVGDFSTPLLSVDRSSRQKNSKDALELKHGPNRHLQDIYLNSYRIHILINTWTFSRIDHIRGHKSTLSKFKKTEIMSYIFSDHKSTKLDITIRRTIKHS